MDLHLLVDNLTNPALLFFFLGLIAVQLRSDLEIPPNSAKFISLYLLFSIGFKGGQELSHSDFNQEVWLMIAAGIGMALIFLFAGKQSKEMSMGRILRHSFTNGSVMLILGSLVIGFVANEQQAAGIKPFTTDIFKGFLAIFLLDMGIASGKKLNSFFKKGWFTLVFAIVIPLVNGSVIAMSSGVISDSVGNRFLLAILAASASYIAVPAAMRIVVPKANPSLYIPMALAITFPLNITLGMPLYLYLINIF